MKTATCAAERAVEQAQESLREALQWQTARAELEEERKRLDGRIVDAMMQVAECLGCVAGRSEYVEVDGMTYRVALDNGKPRMEAIVIRGR